MIRTSDTTAVQYPAVQTHLLLAPTFPQLMFSTAVSRKKKYTIPSSWNELTKFGSARTNASFFYLKKLFKSQRIVDKMLEKFVMH